MKCPFCQIKTNLNHVYQCKNSKISDRIELRKLFLEYNFPNVFTYDNLYQIYITDVKSLPDIKKIYNITYGNTLFMLSCYNIKIRNHSEASLLSMDKRINTNIEKFGAINALSKGTTIYDKRNETVKNKYGVENVFQIPEIKENIKNDTYYLQKHGMTISEYRRIKALSFWNILNNEEKILFIEKCNENRNKTWEKNYNGHPLTDPDVQNKHKNTCMLKYKKEYFFQSSDFLDNDKIKLKSKNTRVKNGYAIADIDIEPFLLYKRKCRNKTNKIRKTLYENWNGYDYYDGEYIKNYITLKYTSGLYPTIDHKISIFYGFINNISIDIISNIDNLCITKRKINCSKGNKNIYEK